MQVLSGLELPLPSIPEQKEIADVFSCLDRKLELETEQKTHLERVKMGLMDLLLTGRVRVKVD
jgi:type I restriction enzyme S subunit